MGQAESTDTSQSPPHTEKDSIPSSFNPSYISNNLLKKNFTNIEDYSLSATFENLLSIRNGKEVIEEEAFIQYLGFPDEIEIGPILYRSFTYLASYPSPAHEENPLTYDGLIKAIAIYCDKINDVILGDRVKLIFESFAIHEEHSALGITPKKGVSYGPKVVAKQPEYTENSGNGAENEVSNTQDETEDDGGLKIEPINFDDDASFLKALGFQQPNDDEPHIVSRVLCTDMIKILTGLVWLTKNEIIPNLSSDDVLSKNNFNVTREIDKIREAITPIVEHMARYDTDNRNLTCSQIFSSQTYIKWPTFKDFMQRNNPNIFNVFKPYFYGQFLIGQTLSLNRRKSLNIDSHMQLLPKLDEESECLNSINLTLLSWMLPEEVLNRKEWNRLYSGSKHGFSVLQFTNHVFRYNGPTLMLIQAQLTTNNNHHHTFDRTHEQALPNASKKEILLIGAYIKDKWRSTSSPRTCFGSEECYLFELSPTFESFPATRRGKNYVYYNPAFGIGFGGIATSGSTSSKIESMDKNSFVIQLDNTLQYGRYRNDALRDMNPTYNVSVTRPYFDISFEVLEIEVVGVGDEGALREKQKLQELSGSRRNSRKGQGDIELLKIAGIIDENNRPEEREP